MSKIKTNIPFNLQVQTTKDKYGIIGKQSFVIHLQKYVSGF